MYSSYVKKKIKAKRLEKQSVLECQGLSMDIYCIYQMCMYVLVQAQVQEGCSLVASLYFPTLTLPKTFNNEQALLYHFEDCPSDLTSCCQCQELRHSHV